MKTKGIYILLLVLVVLNTYDYVDSFVYPETYFPTDGEMFEMKREWQNPLQNIFIGISKYGEDSSITTLSVFARFQMLLKLCLYFGFLFSVFQYFISKYKKTRALTFFLVTQIWISVSIIVFYAIKAIYVQVDSRVIGINENTELMKAGFLAAVCITIAILVLRHLEIQVRERDEDVQPMTEAPSGVRYFHLFWDRFILLFIAVNPFFVRYIYSKMAGRSAYAEQDNLEFLSLATFSVTLLIVYFLTEWLFGLSPTKVFTSSKVVRSSGEFLSPMSALGRTLMRFVPFDNFSFLFGKGWHDRASRTKVVSAISPKYYGEVIHWILLGYIAILTWANFGGIHIILDDLDVARIDSMSGWGYHYQLPLLMSVLFVIPVALLVSSWFGVQKSIASLTLGKEDSGLNNLILLCWFIPFANFFIPGRSVRYLNDDLSGNDYSPEADRLYSGGRTFVILFQIGYFFFVLTCLALVGFNKSGLIVAGICLELFLILFYIGFVIYKVRLHSYLNFQNEKTISSSDSSIS